MSTVPRHARAGLVPLADVRTLLDAIEAVLDLPKHGAPYALQDRLAHMSGVLSVAEDARALRHATAVLRRVAAGGAQ